VGNVSTLDVETSLKRTGDLTSDLYKGFLDSENSKSIKHISPLADDPLALKLNLDSDSEAEAIVKPS
jgi:hypothetical protein